MDNIRICLGTFRNWARGLHCDYMQAYNIQKNNELNNYNNDRKSNRKKKTTTVSFRIDSEYGQLLCDEAGKKVSLNTLANQIFGEHLEWQLSIERFGTITMSKEGFKLLLECLQYCKQGSQGIYSI